MNSVLQNKKNIKFKFEKFPYLIIDDALPTDLYKKLSNSFPKYEKIIAGNEYKENFAYRYNACNSLRDNEISTEWKEFIKFHTSYEFLEEFYSIFGDSIKKIYNVEKERLFKKNNIGVRFDGKNHFNLDCQFVINTPTSGETKVIEPHLDNPVEFYAALLYMKDQNDDSEGGNLTTYDFKGNPIFMASLELEKKK